MNEYHGWSRGVGGTMALHIGILPKRKKPILYLDTGARILPLASFGSVGAARTALRTLDRLILGKIT